MSHQPEDIRLRPSGVVNPRDVKLYPWAVSGNLEITEVESGDGVDHVRVSKLLIILESGSGSETVAKSKPSSFTLTDSGSGVEGIVTEKTIALLESLEAELDTKLWSLKPTSRVESLLRVHATIVDEGRLSVAGEPDRLHSGYIYPIGGIDNLTAVRASSESGIQPRLSSSQKTPRGYHQGHRSWVVDLYTLGRSAVLDSLIDEDGDSTSFELLDIKCLDINGNPSNIFAEECLLADVEVAIEDSRDVILRYTVRCGRWSRTPMMRVLKMTMKPVSAPLTVELIHPELRALTSVLDEVLEQDLETTISASVIPDYFPYVGIIWMIIAVQKTGGALSFSGWEAISLEDSKLVTAVSHTSSGYVVYSSTPFVLDGDYGYGDVSEAGLASFTVPPQDGNSTHYVWCRFRVGWGVYAHNTTSDGYVGVSSGSGLSSGAWESVYHEYSGYRISWYLNGTYVGRGTTSPYISVRPDGTYHVLTNSLS